MAKGKTLSGGQGDTWVVPFYVRAVASVGTATFSTATETLLVGQISSLGEGPPSEASCMTHVVIPFPCRLESVVVQGRANANGDELRIRVRKHAFTSGATAVGAAVDLIDNSVSGSATVDYVRALSTTANEYVVTRYVGNPQTAGAGTGFLDNSTTSSEFVAGDHLSTTAACADVGDEFSHVQVFVVLNRQD